METENFWACEAAHKKQGDSSPALKVKECCQKFNHALDRCLRTELKNSDLTEAKSLLFLEVSSSLNIVLI